MALLNPAALWLLVLVGVVLLLPRIRRRRPRRLTANIYLWSEVDQPSRLRFLLQLRQHWLLILQIAIVSLVIAALARPVLSAGTRRVAFVLDASASMAARDADGSRFDRAREAALSVLDDLPSDARVRVVAARGVTSDLGEFAARDPALRRLLEALDAAAGSASLDDAIATARAAGGPGVELYVFSDRAGGGDVAGWVRVGSPADNVAVEGLAARRLPGSPFDAQLLVQVRNFGASRRQVPLTVRRDGTVVAQETLTVEPFASSSLVCDAGGASGVFSAAIDASDGLAFDNQRFTVLRPSRIPVLLVTTGNFFVRRALETNPGLTVRTIGLSELAAGEAPPEAVIVCDGCAEVPLGGAGALLVAPRAPSGARGPLRVESVPHPVTARVDVSGIMATPTEGSPLPPDADVLIWRGDIPAAAAYERDGRRVVTLQVDVEDSALPLHTAFPVLLANAIDWLAEGAGRSLEVTAGEPVRWQHVDPETGFVTTPDGREIPLVPSGSGAVFNATDLPGPYRVGTDAAQNVFVVNPAIEGESDLSLDPAPLMAVPHGGRPAAAVPHRVHPFAWLVTAAIVLAIMEWRQYCRHAA